MNVSIIANTITLDKFYVSGCDAKESQSDSMTFAPIAG